MTVSKNNDLLSVFDTDKERVNLSHSKLVLPSIPLILYFSRFGVKSSKNENVNTFFFFFFFEKYWTGLFEPVYKFLACLYSSECISH